MTARPCKLCGRQIVLARTPEGKQIALDAEASCYRLMDPSGDAIPAVGYHVNHAFTCRKNGGGK